MSFACALFHKGAFDEKHVHMVLFWARIVAACACGMSAAPVLVTAFDVPSGDFRPRRCVGPTQVLSMISIVYFISYMALI